MNEFFIGLFEYGVLFAGTLSMLSLMLFSVGWSIMQLCKWLKVWHVLALMVSTRLHGKNFHDHQFWWAIEERASKSQWAAKNIADFAMKHAPKDNQ